MGKVIAGLCVISAIALLAIFGRGDPAETTQARTPQDIPRIPQGLPADNSLAEGQILPWDNSGIQAWIDDRIASLDPLITDENYRQQTTDFSIRLAGVDGNSRGFYYTPTYDAVNNMFYGDEEESQAGLFVVLHMAKAGDAWAYYNLANWHLDDSDTPPSVPLDLFREAADREFLPAIVNLVIEWYEGNAVPPKVLQAYLHYGFDMNASDGHWNITRELINFYVHDNPTISSDGYLDRAFATMRDDYGGGLQYHQDLGIRFDEGIDGPIDKAAALREFIASVEQGGTWALNRIGYKYMGGSARGTSYNKDLARDYLLACLIVDPNDYCALNLGSLYFTPSRNSVDYAVAHAFYRHGTGMNGDNRTKLLAEIQNILPRMSDDDIARANIYYDDILRGDFSAIPHVKDARNVLP